MDPPPRHQGDSDIRRSLRREAAQPREARGRPATIHTLPRQPLTPFPGSRSHPSPTATLTPFSGSHTHSHPSPADSTVAAPASPAGARRSPRTQGCRAVLVQVDVGFIQELYKSLYKHLLRRIGIYNLLESPVTCMKHLLRSLSRTDLPNPSPPY